MAALWAEELLKLQAIDGRIDNVRTRLSLLPKERDRILAAKKAADAEAAAADRRLAEFRAALRRMEAEVKALEDKRDRVRQQSVTVKKNEEYQTLLKESAMLDAAVGELEAKTLAEMDRLPAEESAAAETRRAAARTIRELKQEYLEFAEAEKAFLADLAALRRERQSVAETIDPRRLRPYEELRKAGDGDPLVPVDANGGCGHCCIGLTPQTRSDARAGTFVRCDNCGHLVYCADI